MKKSEFAMKKARRRSVKDMTIVKKMKGDVRGESTKDVLQVVTGKLISDPSSMWYGSELLYIIRTQKRGKRLGQQNAPSAKTAGTQPDRYIAMLRKKDASQSISVIRIVLKDGDIELKNNFDLLSSNNEEFIKEFKDYVNCNNKICVI